MTRPSGEVITKQFDAAHQFLPFFRTCNAQTHGRLIPLIWLIGMYIWLLSEPAQIALYNSQSCVMNSFQLQLLIDGLHGLLPYHS
jgi:hypothetical protein